MSKSKNLEAFEAALKENRELLENLRLPKSASLKTRK